MLREFDPALRESGWVFFRPDFVFGYFEDWAAVLKDEVEVRVEVGQLDEEAACIGERGRLRSV